MTHFSLFSGIGGIDLAAEAAGFVTVCQCEAADYPSAVLEKHWPGVPRFKDIYSVTKEEFYGRTGQRSPTLLSGGFPCQPFSSAGAKRGFADSRYLWPQMCRIIAGLRPRYVLGENVANFVNMGLHRTLSDLEQEGYAAGAFVLPACAVGAWHERKRVFIIGIDVSNSPCKRCGDEAGCAKGCTDAGRGVQEPAAVREVLGRIPFGGGILPGAGCGQQLPHKPGMGGMDDGIPAEMDGDLIWGAEPAGIPRQRPRAADDAKRLKALGNAVVPAQAYPVLKYIADIETGRCREWCPGQRHT